jgi:hypothetical protein
MEGIVFIVSANGTEDGGIEYRLGFRTIDTHCNAVLCTVPNLHCVYVFEGRNVKQYFLKNMTSPDSDNALQWS